jgi:hypothetical protein
MVGFAGLWRKPDNCCFFGGFQEGAPRSAFSIVAAVLQMIAGYT